MIVDYYIDHTSHPDLKFKNGEFVKTGNLLELDPGDFTQYPKLGLNKEVLFTRGIVQTGVENYILNYLTANYVYPSSFILEKNASGRFILDIVTSDKKLVSYLPGTPLEKDTKKRGTYELQ